MLSIYTFIEFEEIVQILIEKGANVNASNVNGDSALIRAATTGNYRTPKIDFYILLRWRNLDVTGPESLIKLLIENGADVNAVNDVNNSALILAISNGKSYKIYWNF